MNDFVRKSDSVWGDHAAGPADTLKALVAELASTRIQLEAIARRSREGGIEAALARLTAAVGGLHARLAREGTQPLADAFAALHPLLRDLGSSLHKEICLVLVGDAIELERHTVDGQRAPLAHLVRACALESVELPHDRRAAGKMSAATIRVSASRSAAGLVVSVSDDGCGLDLVQIGTTAMRWGLVDDAGLAQMTPDDLANLVFAPGFATAAQVTGSAGGRVSLDAVRADIEALGGSLAATTRAGEGTTFTINLPAREAVVPEVTPAPSRARTLLFTAGSPDVKALPLSLVKRIETVRAADIERSAGRLVIRRDDGLLALLPLVEGTPLREQEQPVLIVEAAGHTFGLLVDEVLDIGDADEMSARFDVSELRLTAEGCATELAQKLMGIAPREPRPCGLASHAFTAGE